VSPRFETQLRIMRSDDPPSVQAVILDGNPPTWRSLNELIRPLLDGGDLEHVRVFTHFAEGEPDRYLDMFVDEMGGPKGLPRNDRATVIYRNNVLVHAPAEYPDPEALPMIYGTAVLFARRVWFCLILGLMALWALMPTQAQACGKGQILRVSLHRCVAVNSSLARGFARRHRVVHVLRARVIALPAAPADACGIWHPIPQGWPGDWMRSQGFDKQWRWRL
jgi:hypothetical protein